MASISAELHDIQGNILRAYGFPCARYEIARITSAPAARRLLGGLLERGWVTSAATWDPDAKPGSTLNIFFSWHGLAALGLPAASLDSFPEEFRKGMPARKDVLGDVGRNDPAQWEFGTDPEQAHVFFAVYGRTPANRDAMLSTLRAEAAKVGSAVAVTHALDAEGQGNHGEHFGFADGIGQPAIEGSGAPEYPGDGTPLGDGTWAPLKAGEFVLGWPGETGYPVSMPAPEALGRNGSYLVYRKLAQDVVAFRTFLREQAVRVYGSDSAEDVERLAAKLVGRWRSGCPLMRSPDRDDRGVAADWSRNNDFRYASDPEGRTCPVGSHIRRLNPRDALDARGDELVRTHRIVRRGLPYGTWLDGDVDDGQERGVAFMAINSSIAYQFEHVQRAWANSGEFAGLDRQDVDPLAGEPRQGSRFRVYGPEGAPKRLTNLPAFVTLKGGGYFFIPGLTALRLIASNGV